MALSITLEQVITEQCRRSFGRYTEETSGFKLHPWQSILAKRLQLLETQTGQRILIHKPPQTGGSQLISKRLPAWLVWKKNRIRIILAAYNKTHACGLIESAKYAALHPVVAGEVTWVKSNDDDGTYTKERFALNDAQPNLIGVGLDSGFTGKNADLLIIDDPYPNAEDARSEAYNRKVRSFWKETAEPRIMANPDANVVVMFHRYHEADIAGFLMEQGEDWEVITFPAIADGDPNDPTDRQVGELLSPFHTREGLAKKELEDPKTFAGQFQGKPKSDSEGLFQAEMFEYVEEWEVPPLQTFYRGWDTAAKAKQGNDPTASICFGIDSLGTVWITSAMWEWLNWTNLCTVFCNTLKDDGPNTIHAVEDASSGIQLFDEMTNPSTRPEMMGYIIHSVSHGNRDKRFRATPVATRAAIRPIKVVKFGKHKELVKHFTDFDGLGLSFDHTVDALSTAWAIAFKEEGEKKETHASSNFKQRAGIS